MEPGKNSVIYMGLISGPNKADDTCGRTTVTGTMDTGFTVYVHKYINTHTHTYMTQLTVVFRNCFANVLKTVNTPVENHSVNAV
jgi:hypothetical protein